VIICDEEKTFDAATEAIMNEWTYC